MDESISQVSQAQTSATVSGSSESSTAQVDDPYVLKCRLERGQLRAHMIALKAMLQRQAELEDRLFACEAGEPIAAVLSRPSPLMGAPDWASRSKAEAIVFARRGVEARMEVIAKVLGVDD